MIFFCPFFFLFLLFFLFFFSLYLYLHLPFCSVLTLRQVSSRCFHAGGGSRSRASARTLLCSLSRHHRTKPTRVTLPSWSFSSSPSGASAPSASLKANKIRDGITRKLSESENDSFAPPHPSIQSTPLSKYARKFRPTTMDAAHSSFDTPNTSQSFALGSSNVCLVGERPTCSVLALQGCKDLWKYTTNGHA